MSTFGTFQNFSNSSFKYNVWNKDYVNNTNVLTFNRNLFNFWQIPSLTFHSNTNTHIQTLYMTVDDKTHTMPIVLETIKGYFFRSS